MSNGLQHKSQPSEETSCPQHTLHSYLLMQIRLLNGIQQAFRAWLLLALLKSSFTTLLLILLKHFQFLEHAPPLSLSLSLCLLIYDSFSMGFPELGILSLSAVGSSNCLVLTFIIILISMQLAVSLPPLPKR